MIFKRTHRAPAAAALACLLLAGACQEGESFRGKAVEEPARPNLAGTNWDGARFQLQEAVQGKVSILSFGYTMCPDVCPFTLAKLRKLRSELGDEADDLAVVFASVDPHRDTVKKLADYVPKFHPSFYGVRMTFDEIDKAKEDFNLTVQYGQPKDGPGTDSFYYVDHTGTYFLLDRQGRLRVTFPPNAKAEEILSDVKKLMASGGEAF